MSDGSRKIVEMKNALDDGFPAYVFNTVFGKGWEKTV